ncbi:hypothetical protein K470DRAFT_204125, partial [Piedraia hortae CBS 480.64]
DEDDRPLSQLTLYETPARYWVTGTDVRERRHRVLRIDRTSPPGEIGLFEDETTYSRDEMRALLSSMDEGNRSSGGLRLKCYFWALLGFIRFTESYYMLIVTKRRQVASVGGHSVYQIAGTELIPLTSGSGPRFGRNADETRFRTIMGNLDLTRHFYFSPMYDITNTLQTNMMRGQGNQSGDEELHREMFVWNDHLLQPAMVLKRLWVWCRPIIHGFIDQMALDVLGRRVYITIIARRSRFFAGARFLKRGVNDRGHVANDVETEQIVAEKLTTSFHATNHPYANPTYSSYVQHRGSIPLSWTQDASGVTPKPDIELNAADPFCQAAALHFDDLFGRYGAPVIVLNLIKSRERMPRESKLLGEFERTVRYLNQSLPANREIEYRAYDMSRISKTRGGDVIGGLETIARDLLVRTSIFHNGGPNARIQNGVVRTNCIDCLDRTNAAQFIIGKRAMVEQLRALGLFDGQELDFDSGAVEAFTRMFHNHGDTIAVQYGGSQLVNTLSTYRKINQWQGHSRDMFESFKRYYHNSFLDAQRQEAINLFLGNYIFTPGGPMLWDLATDLPLHQTHPRERGVARRSYIHWFTPEHLRPRELGTRHGEANDCYWVEYYRPRIVSSLEKTFAYKLNS